MSIIPNSVVAGLDIAKKGSVHEVGFSNRKILTTNIVSVKNVIVAMIVFAACVFVAFLYSALTIPDRLTHVSVFCEIATFIKASF